MRIELGLLACVALGCDSSSASSSNDERSPHAEAGASSAITTSESTESDPLHPTDTAPSQTTQPIPQTQARDGGAPRGDDASSSPLPSADASTPSDETTFAPPDDSGPDSSTVPPVDEEPIPADGDDLGAYPALESPITRGGTMTFRNVGAKGSWPRRLDREAGDAACDYKDGTDTWGGQCCMTEYMTESEQLSPFDEEMTLILKAIDIKQLAVYQPAEGDDGPWSRISAWDARTTRADNLWFTQEGDGSATFPGDLTRNDCVGYVMQAPSFECAQAQYSCPNDPGVLHQGFAGSKLIVFLGSMNVDDAAVTECGGDGPGHPGPWVAFVASELIRDGGRKWNGLCNCYSKTGSVGDGCGEINVFEVVMDDNEFSNREFASTGVRSYQAGHVGGAVCKSDCERDAFAADADVVDACAGAAYDQGPELEVGGATDGCPVWRRPEGDRYFFILLDRPTRTIVVGMIHPGNIPATASDLLPALPGALSRSGIDSLVELRLPE